MKRTTSVSTLLSLVTGTLVAVLVTVFAVSAMAAWKRERQSVEIAASARVSRDIVRVREALRVELGVIDTAISEPEVASPALVARLKALHLRTLDAMGYVERQILQTNNEKLPPEVAQRFARTAYDFDRRLFPAILHAIAQPRETRSERLITDPQSVVYGILNLVDQQAAVLLLGTGELPPRSLAVPQHEPSRLRHGPVEYSGRTARRTAWILEGNAGRRSSRTATGARLDRRPGGQQRARSLGMR